MNRGSTRRVFMVATVAANHDTINNTRLDIELPGKEKNHMFISKASLPVSARGKGTATPTASIRENGQLSLNKPVVTQLKFASGEKSKQMLIDWDNDKRILTLFVYAGTLPKGHQEDEFYTLMNSEKVGGAYCGLAGLWKQLGYEYKESGNQNFSATVAEGKGVAKVSFEVPKGKLTPKPVTPRKAKAASAGAASNGSANTTVSTGELEEVE